MINLARKWVLDSGKTVAEAMKEYDDACIDFAGEFLEAIGRGRLAYFEDMCHPDWRYHAAVEIDGVIHDLWTESPMPTAEYMENVMLAESVDYPLERAELTSGQ